MVLFTFSFLFTVLYDKQAFKKQEINILEIKKIKKRETNPGLRLQSRLIYTRIQILLKHLKSMQQSPVMKSIFSYYLLSAGNVDVVELKGIYMETAQEDLLLRHFLG